VNYTDSSNLVVGVKYVYTITTVDRNGNESSPAVCDNVIAVEIEPPSFKALIVFLVICIGGLVSLALLVFSVVCLISNRQALRRGGCLKLNFWRTPKHKLLEIEGEDDDDIALLAGHDDDYD